MNNDRGNTELTVNVPKGASFETFKSIVQKRGGPAPDDWLAKLYADFVALNELEEKSTKEMIAIIGDLFEKYKGKTDRESVKKMKEIEDVAAYLLDIKESSGYNVAIVSEGESPDFIVEVNGHRIGLEHTIYVNDETVAKISTIQLVLSIIEKNLLLENPNLKMLLNVSFLLDKVPNRNELHLALQEYLSSVVKGQHSNKPNFINAMIVSEHETFQIKYNEECKPTPIDVEHFEAKLDAKDAKIENYKKTTGLDKVNLLMIIEGVGCKSNFFIDLEQMPKKKRSFDQIIIYNRFEHTILVGQ